MKMSRLTPSFMSDSVTRLLLFGGKGGVGKTTLAAATALYWARQDAQRKVLIVSTDPAHSLRDSFDQPIGDVITPIVHVPTLFALEMDASKRLEVFTRNHGPVLRKILDRGTYFDQEDIAGFLDLSLPGLDELMAVIEIAGIVKEKTYDLVILDTAPTGHTLRLLSLPRLMEHWIHVLNLSMEKHRYMASIYGRYHPDEADAFLKLMKDDLDLLESVLGDPVATEFVPVTIPEVMSIAETGRLHESLKELHIRVKTLIVNRVVMPSPSICLFCEERRSEQESCLEEIRNNFPLLHTVHIPLLSHHVRGQADLLDVGQLLLGGSLTPPLPLVSQYPSPEIGEQRQYRAEALEKTRLLLFGGKGGVGKTTVATATALSVASFVDPSTNKKTLLFSTDPAHSLSDSLAQPIGNQVTPVVGVPQLFALEMDAADLLEDLKRDYEEELNEVFNSFSRGTFDIKFDREVMEELFNMTPPGLDELMALMKIMDFIDEGEFGRYVLDLAPTGHALRFLEAPTVVRKWFITFIQLLLKYQGVASLSKVGELLRQKSKQLRRVQQLLLDPEQCQFITVTIPEPMAVLETKRMINRLVELKIPCHLVVTNMLMPASDCPFCSTVRSRQQPYLKEIDSVLPWSIRLPLFPRAVQGFDKLSQIADQLYRGWNG
jgi:arsenite/tail-anchored protein-transporting ATPase